MYSWQFSSEKERPQSWYIIALIVVLSLVLYGIIEGLYLMSIVAFLFAGVYILLENNNSPITTVSINDHVIMVGETVYEFDKIDRFALLSNAGSHVMLRLFLRKGISSMIDIPLTEAVDTVGLRDLLGESITYDNEADWTKSDRLIHTMRL